MKIAFSKDAQNTLKRMSSSDARRVLARIEAYAADPRGQGHDVVKLQGRDGYRMRIGRTWRVIFDQDGTVMTIIMVGARGQIYER